MLSPPASRERHKAPKDVEFIQAHVDAGPYERGNLFR